MDSLLLWRKLLSTLLDGEVVEMDGATGIVRRMPPETEAKADT